MSQSGVTVPTAQPWSCTFAGENLERMFVIPVRIDNERDPLARALFEVDPGMVGLPSGQYDG